MVRETEEDQKFLYKIINELISYQKEDNFNKEETFIDNDDSITSLVNYLESVERHLKREVSQNNLNLLNL